MATFVSYVCFTMVLLIFCVIKCLPVIIFSYDASPLIAVMPQRSRKTFLGRLREWDSLRCCWFGTDTWCVCLTFKDGSFWRFTIRLEFLDNHSRQTIYLLHLFVRIQVIHNWNPIIHNQWEWVIYNWRKSVPFFPLFFGFWSFVVVNIPILSPFIYNWSLIIYNRDVDFKWST